MFDIKEEIIPFIRKKRPGEQNANVTADFKEAPLKLYE